MGVGTNCRYQLSRMGGEKRQNLLGSQLTSDKQLSQLSGTGILPVRRPDTGWKPVPLPIKASRFYLFSAAGTISNNT